MTNSNAKGKRAERQLSRELRRYGLEARRGQQHAGGPGFPDVVHNLPRVHFEVKWNEKLDIGTALLIQAIAQAARDAPPGHLPVVAWKHRNKQWRVSYRTSLGLVEGETSLAIVTTTLHEFMLAQGYKLQEAA